jgi:hypothetical protein
MSTFFASPVTALVVTIIVLAVLARFFRHMFLKLVVALVAEVFLFALFPSMLIFFVHLITSIRAVLRT